MASLQSRAIILVCLAFCISYCTFEAVKKPYIGIISTPSDFHNLYDPKEYSYIKGAYGEYIEAANAIPVAIPWDLPEYELINVMDSINGILFTGGDATLWETNQKTGEVTFSNFTKRAAFILNYAIYLNDKGIHYPVYGICQGHEVITLGLAGTPHPIDHFVHPGQLDTVHITEEGRSSRMFGNMPDHLVEFMKGRRSIFYNHRYGFNLSLLVDHEILDNFFTITAKGVDDNGKPFIAAMEAKNYPIYTVQYHPERILSEWRNKTHYHHPDESGQAVIVQAVFFVSEAMRNQQHLYSDERLEKFVMRNHETVAINSTFPEVYFYDKKSIIAYDVDPAWSDYSDLEGYECKHHDCGFISDL